MLDIHVAVVRSRPVTGAELAGVLDALTARYARSTSDFSRYDLSQRGGTSLARFSLPRLDAYCEVPFVPKITLHAESCFPNDTATFVEMTRATHDVSLSHAWTKWHVEESEQANRGEDDVPSLSISAGRRTEGYFSGVYLLGCSSLADDTARRRAFFDSVIKDIGTADAISTRIEDGVLYLSAASPWKLVFPASEVGGGNPSGFYACGFEGVEEALAAGQRLVRRFVKKIVGVSFVVTLNREGYDSVAGRLNELWHRGWWGDVLGDFSADAMAILRGGDLPPNPPSWIPACKWFDDQADATAHVSVVIENGQRYLEVSTYNTNTEQLLAWVDFLKDIPFHPVTA